MQVQPASFLVVWLFPQLESPSVKHVGISCREVLTRNGLLIGMDYRRCLSDGFLNIPSINPTSSESLASTLRAIINGCAAASAVFPCTSISVFPFVSHLRLHCDPIQRLTLSSLGFVYLYHFFCQRYFFVHHLTFYQVLIQFPKFAFFQYFCVSLRNQ